MDPPRCSNGVLTFLGLEFFRQTTDNTSKGRCTEQASERKDVPWCCKTSPLEGAPLRDLGRRCPLGSRRRRQFPTATPPPGSSAMGGWCGEGTSFAISSSLAAKRFARTLSSRPQPYEVKAIIIPFWRGS